MQTNFWDRIVLVCGNHNNEEKLPQMLPHSPASGSMSRSLYGEHTSMFYSCPRYYPENRNPGNHVAETIFRSRNMQVFSNILKRR